MNKGLTSVDRIHGVRAILDQPDGNLKLRQIIFAADNAPKQRFGLSTTTDLAQATVFEDYGALYFNNRLNLLARIDQKTGKQPFFWTNEMLTRPSFNEGLFLTPPSAEAKIDWYFPVSDGNRKKHLFYKITHPEKFQKTIEQFILKHPRLEVHGQPVSMTQFIEQPSFIKEMVSNGSLREAKTLSYVESFSGGAWEAINNYKYMYWTDFEKVMKEGKPDHIKKYLNFNLKDFLKLNQDLIRKIRKTKFSSKDVDDLELLRISVIETKENLARFQQWVPTEISEHPTFKKTMQAWTDFFEDLPRVKEVSSEIRHFEPTQAATFKTALESSRHPKHPDRVWIRETSDYQKILDDGGHLFLSKDHKTGFGVTVDGGLISLFNNGSTPGLGASGVEMAKKMGAKHLHCWGLDLAHYYEKFGFKIKEEIPWDEELWVNDFPPEGPKPNAYYMELEHP